jgi:hypothetical protein
VTSEPSVETGLRPTFEISDPTPDFQELWFALQRWRWTSLVVVPADEGGSAVRIVQSLAAVGTRLHGAAVTAVLATGLDFTSAAQTAKALSGIASANGRGAVSPPDQAIVAVEPVIERPLAIAVARSADLALLYVEMGKTRVASAQRSVELVGRDRFLGCLVLT